MAKKDKSKKRNSKRGKGGEGGEGEEKVGVGHGRLKVAGKSDTQMGNTNCSHYGKWKTEEKEKN